MNKLEESMKKAIYKHITYTNDYCIIGLDLDGLTTLLTEIMMRLSVEDINEILNMGGD